MDFDNFHVDINSLSLYNGATIDSCLQARFAPGKRKWLCWAPSYVDEHVLLCPDLFWFQCASSERPLLPTTECLNATSIRWMEQNLLQGFKMALVMLKSAKVKIYVPQSLQWAATRPMHHLPFILLKLTNRRRSIAEEAVVEIDIFQWCLW